MKMKFYMLPLASLLFICNVNYGNYNLHSDTINFAQPFEVLDSLMYYYKQQGINASINGDYETAMAYLSKSLEIAKHIYIEPDLRIAAAYVNLGIIHERTWDYETALNYYNYAEELYRVNNPDHADIGAIYGNKAIIYRKLRDYDKAINYSNMAIKIYLKQDEINYERLRSAHYNLGIIHEYAGLNKEAIKYFEQSQYFDRSKLTERILKVYNSIAINYSILNEFDLAEKYHNISMSLVDSAFPGTNIHAASVKMSYGVFQIDYVNNLELAEKYLSIAHQINIEIFGLKNTYTAIGFQNLGEVFEKRDLLDSALYYYQQSLISEDLNFNDPEIYVNPPIDMKSQRPRIMNTLKSKGRTLAKRYAISNNLKDLEMSLETYLLVLDYIDIMRLKYESDKSKYIISEQENNTFLKATDVAYQLFRLTGDKHYLETAFEINERRTAFSLLTSIRKFEAKEFGGIPVLVSKEENDLFRQISAYEELLYAEKNKVFPDKGKISAWEEKLFYLYEDNEKLLKTIELQYPRYYALKYNAATISADETRNRLDDDHVLLEYAVGDEAIIIFLIKPEESEMLKVDIDSAEFSRTVHTILFNLSRPNFSADVKQAYEDYTEAAYKMYRYLIEPCREFIEGKALIIIPDGILAYLPFEALLSCQVDSGKINYHHLPYLLRDHDISYSYSATLHFERDNQKSKPERNLIAFAPDYSYNLAQLGTEPAYLDNYRDQLVPLPGITDEVKYITRLFKGDLFADEQATESNFKKQAGSYNILHLAMHTIIDNENPMYTKLAFTQNVDTAEDGFLNTYEIYNMRYNARMVVLSACRTGFGKLLKGEGVMSLARSFMYAGCPSIIMTLWEVSDRSGAMLMKNFYRQLKQGMSKSEALRQAKLDFIMRADQLKAHPYFWSTYVAIGDASPIYDDSRRKYLFAGIALTGILACLALFIQLRRRKNNSHHRLFRTDKLFS